VPLTKAVRELSEKNDRLEKEITELKELVRALAGNGNNTPISANAWMKQNAPNPSNANTSVQYFVPPNSTAKIVLSNAKGQEIKTWMLDQGAGVVTINSRTLAAGYYNYTLWLDGKRLITRKMIVSK
jgi:hypothetical protein